ARAGTQRIYSHKDRTRLQLILRGKRVGFSLSEIKEIIELYKVPKGESKQTEFLKSKINERRIQLNQQAKDIKLMLQQLDELEQRIS
ncbi:MAG: MerR family DNA-binding protein, partial [Kangiellaceae bacterium]|nr:MerR family DNA-binding protein [Kangiellaceae bacterium]